ncbi:MAG TPA: radical SAM family heme chaperone HemW [Anaerolineaceae bacterium]|nr:radical SAM family heme chaperone HemW [Anaerolineaceae bacterium]
MEKINSIYLHIPFCQKRCSYCDFNTFSGMNHMIPAYVEQLINEIKYYSQSFSERQLINTIFFGGGTPSLIEISHYKQLFEIIKEEFIVSPQAEISLEANPGSVSLDYLQKLLEIGFNRISFGLQTSNPSHLSLLGRIHDHHESIQAISNAKKAGFRNINLDLIYSLPGQTLEDWKKVLDDCLRLDTQHFSLYALGVEENTPLYEWVKKGMVENPDPDVAAEMYEVADQLLTNSGFECYEISNYFKKEENRDWRCQHNLQYWRNGNYLGLGAGAHGYIGNLRYENVGSIPDYISRMKRAYALTPHESSVIRSSVKVSQFTAMQEQMMLGLRLVSEGVSIREFISKFKQSPLTLFKTEIDYLIRNQLIDIQNDLIYLTKKGRLLGNIVFRQFVD